MSADDLTLDALEDLAALLAETCHAVRLIRLRAEAGEISPDQAYAEFETILTQLKNAAA